MTELQTLVVGLDCALTGHEAARVVEAEKEESPKEFLKRHALGIAPVVTALAETDDGKIKVTWNACSFFAEANANDIVNLAKIGYCHGYAADFVAEWFAESLPVMKHFFRYVQENDGGYEVYVHQKEAEDYLRRYRPDVYVLLQRKRLAEAEESPKDFLKRHTPKCKQCQSVLTNGYCSQVGCLYYEWPQVVDYDDLCRMTRSELWNKYGARAGDRGIQDVAEANDLVESLLWESPQMATLKKSKTKLDPEERDQVMQKKAVWHHGPTGGESPAVWKSVVRGKTWYVTNTHRAYQARPTLGGAISAFHSFIKDTA